MSALQTDLLLLGYGWKHLTEERKLLKNRENALPSPSSISKADNKVINELFLTESSLLLKKPEVERSC